MRIMMHYYVDDNRWGCSFLPRWTKWSDDSPNRRIRDGISHLQQHTFTAPVSRVAIHQLHMEYWVSACPLLSSERRLSRLIVSSQRLWYLHWLLTIILESTISLYDPISSYFQGFHSLGCADIPILYGIRLISTARSETRLSAHPLLIYSTRDNVTILLNGSFLRCWRRAKHQH